MPLRACTGFEFGTTTCWAAGNAGNKVFDTITGAPTIVTTTPRTGTYCLQVAQSASSVASAWSTDTLATTQNRGRVVMAIRFPTSLPTTDVEIAAFTGNFNAELWYRGGSTNKLAVVREGGTKTDGPAISADTWYVVELYVDMSGATMTIDWWVDGVAQTQHATATVAQSILTFELGCSFLLQTMTCLYDDVLIYTDTAAISGPVGAHKVRLLSVDPAGTVTLSGTATNFNTFTANGTLAAWNATTARNNVDEIPPVFGASADGWVQVNLLATDYVQMPLTTYTLAAGESVSGGRMLVPGWATTTTAATIGFRSWNGTTETTLFAAGDPNFDSTNTATGWVCKMLTLADIDTQAEIDALAIRAGFSTDATPDIGIHAAYVELAVKQATGPPPAPTPQFVSQYGSYF